MEIRIARGRQVIDSGLVEQIIEFDKKNMKPVLKQAGAEFPEERRREGLRSDPTLIIAFEGQAVAGYLEYLRSWNDPNYIYVASIQIDEKHRRTSLIIRLIDEFRSLAAEEDFVGFETNVQKTNLLAIKMYEKIGFKLEENPRNDASWLARAERRILEDSPILPLIDKWRRKDVRRGAARHHNSFDATPREPSSRR